ncbi:hypothetical protein, partial [Streptomyces fradiae]
MTLDNLIDALTAVDSTLIVPDGFTNPHSYRGYYDEVAFEPAHDVTAGAMLADALAARGATYTGWKGGEYTMTGDTPCWLAHEGSAGGEALDEDRVRRMLASARPADAAGGAEVTILDFAEPSGCTHCGVPKHHHGLRGHHTAGLHAWGKPAQQQIKDRMRARRAARQAAAPTQYHARTAWMAD